MEKLLRDLRFFKLLVALDQDLAREAELGRCPHCGARLHRGDYPRKPRGGPALGWDRRYSFDCSRCRRRTTPPSVRFLGRRVYLGVVVVLLGALMHGASPGRVERLRLALGVAERTLKRWREWWLEQFVDSRFWKAGRAAFMPPVPEGTLPRGLVEAFDAAGCAGMVKLLKFLAPITCTKGREGLAM